jgi:YYY domain-containing protein
VEAWLLLVYLSTLAVLPLALVLMRGLPDRGYLLAKPLGVLLASYVPWLLASLRLLPFGRGSVFLGLGALFALSLLLALPRRRELFAWLKARWPLVLIGEGVFLAAFFSFLLVRMANPDLWHPFRGGEKPMDLAYLNAIVRSSFMPPYDPWLAGGSLNYYYFGQFMVAAFIKASGIPPEIAYNLAVPLFFALTFSAAFSIVYNLAEGARRALAGPAPQGLAGRNGVGVGPVLAGLAGGLLVAVLGNLDGSVQLLQGAWRSLVVGKPFPSFDFWRPTRMMPPDPPGFEVTEFPFFTFLFADLHAHLLALPLALLSVGLSLNLLLLPRAGWRASLPALALLALVLGALPATNVWDYPLYLAVALTTLAVAETPRSGGFRGSFLLRLLVLGGLLVALSVLAFYPYHSRLVAAYGGVVVSPARTAFHQYLAVHGLLLFLVLSLLASQARLLWRRLEVWAASLKRNFITLALLFAAGASASGFVLILVSAGYATVVFLLPFLGLAGWLAFRALRSGGPAGPFVGFALLLAGASFLVGMGVDVVTLKGDIDRMNTVFKFYLQGWVLMALAGAFGLWKVTLGGGLGGRKETQALQGRVQPGAELSGAYSSLPRGAAGEVQGLPFEPLSLEDRGRLKGLLRRLPRGVWFLALGTLVLSAGVYPVLGARARLADRFAPLPLTLDGTAFMEGATFEDAVGRAELKWDRQAIRWLRENLQGSPVVLEAQTPLYRWGSRVSIYTGLPTVVGWDWHQAQQRCGLDPCPLVERRSRDVKLLYTSTDPDLTLELLRRYQVEYVYVGETERNYYPPEGLEKFDRMAGVGQLTLAYQNLKVRIYRVP